MFTNNDLIKTNILFLLVPILLILFFQTNLYDYVFALHNTYDHDINTLLHDEETKTFEQSAKENMLLAESYIKQKKYAYAALHYDKVAKVHEGASLYHIYLGECDDIEKDMEHCGESFYHKNQAAKFYTMSALNYVKINEHQSAADQYSMAALNHVFLGHFGDASDNYSGSAYHFAKSNHIQDFKKQHALSLKYKRMLTFGEDYILPPLHQIYLVDDPTKIICKDRLFSLIFKRANSMPNCVLPYTASKLIERGWGYR